MNDDEKEFFEMNEKENDIFLDLDNVEVEEYYRKNFSFKKDGEVYPVSFVIKNDQIELVTEMINAEKSDDPKTIFSVFVKFAKATLFSERVELSDATSYQIMQMLLPQVSDELEELKRKNNKRKGQPTKNDLWNGRSKPKYI